MNKSMKFSERDIEEIVNRLYNEFQGDIKKAAKEMCLREQTLSIYAKSQHPTIKTLSDANHTKPAKNKSEQYENTRTKQPRTPYTQTQIKEQKTQKLQSQKYQTNKEVTNITTQNSKKQNLTKNIYQITDINSKKSIDKELINKTETFAEQHYRETPFTKSFLFVLKRLYEGTKPMQIEEEMHYANNINKFTETVIKTKLETYQKEYNVTTPTQLYEKIFKQKT